MPLGGQDLLRGQLVKVYNIYVIKLMMNKHLVQLLLLLVMEQQLVVLVQVLCHGGE